MEAIDKLRAAQKHIKLWTKIYNKLCRTCQVNLVTQTRAAQSSSTGDGIESSKSAIDNLCDKCKERVAKQIKAYKK